MAALPADLEYGKAVGRYILAVGDGSDPDRLPDAEAADGKILITPKAPVMRTASPSAVVIKQPITCTTDETTGELLDPEGAVGVWLVTGQYTVTYQFARATLPAHDIEILPTHTDSSPLDLGLALPPGGPLLTPSEFAVLDARLQVVEAGGGGGGGGGDVPSSRTITAGTGLTGGGTLAADRTISVDFGTTAGKVAEGNHGHAAVKITDSTTVGRAVLTAADAATARTAIGAGTSSLVLGSTAATAKAGDYVPAWGDVIGTPVTFPPTIGSTATTAVAGNDSRLSDSRTPTAHTHAAGDVSSGTLNIARVPTGTTSSTVALGDHSHTAAAVGAVPTSRTVNSKALSADVTLTASDVGAAATSHAHPVADISATGTKDSTTFLRGDGKWETPAGGGGADSIPYLSGVWRTSWTMTHGIQGGSRNNVLSMSPIFIGNSGAGIDRLSVLVTGAGSSGAVMRLGLYRVDNQYAPESGITLVSDFGTVATDSTGAKEATGSTGALSPGLYILAAASDGNGTTVMSCDAYTGAWSAIPAATWGMAWPGANERQLAGWAKTGNYTAGLPATVSSFDRQNGGVYPVFRVIARFT